MYLIFPLRGPNHLEISPQNIRFYERFVLKLYLKRKLNKLIFQSALNVKNLPPDPIGHNLRTLKSQFTLRVKS